MGIKIYSAGHGSIGWPLDEPAYFGPAEGNLVHIALNVNNSRVHIRADGGHLARNRG